MHTYIDGPTPLVIVLYNFLFLLAIVLIIAGFRAYFRLNPVPTRYIAYLLASIITYYLFITVYPNYHLRVLASTLFMALFTIDAWLESRPAIRNERVKVKRTIFVVIGFLLGFFILRIMLVLFLADNNADLIQNMASTALTTGFFSVFTYNFWLVGSMLLETDRIVRSLNAENQKMEDLAMFDPLTKLFNRNKMENDLAILIEKSNRNGDIASILLMDVDHFKQINDQYGHDAGDEVLVQTADVIRGLLRGDDRVYRWGGDEFLILAHHTDLNGAAMLAQRIIGKFEETTMPIINKLELSIGCAQHFQYEARDDWFKRVDLTLYKAKQAGRNRYETWANTDLLPASIAKLVWSDVFESGHPEIDNQHKGLLGLSNELYDKLGSSDSMADMEEILDHVAHDLTAHFIYESDLMEATNFPLTTEHKQIHEQLLKEYAALRDQLREGKLNLGAFFNFVSVRIVAEHIIKEDTKFFVHLKSHGLT